jgi:hypothetical protein
MKSFPVRLYRNFMLMPILALVLSSCSQHGSGWRNTLVKQMNAPGSIPQVDSAVLEFMLDYNIPGMSIAIAKDGKMIYIKGRGEGSSGIGQGVQTCRLQRRRRLLLYPRAGSAGRSIWLRGHSKGSAQGLGSSVKGKDQGT